MLPSTSSPLLQLPGELRNQIYTSLFAGATLTFGERSPSPVSSWQPISPLPNFLAILRVCRQINQEAGPIWLREVLFCFENPVALLGHLSVLPSTTLSQIRHVRMMFENKLRLQPIGAHRGVTYRLVSALKLLPALRLDTLTVLEHSCNGGDHYDTLSGLIEYGNGWRELHYITPTSEMLGFGRTSARAKQSYFRKPQPSTWNEILSRRDGAGSGASVTIYRSRADNSVLNPRARELFEQKISPPEDLEHFGVEHDEQFMVGIPWSKGLLVIVKRGRDADIAEYDGPPYTFDEDIRQWAHGMTWADIRQCVCPLWEEENEEDEDTEA